jgi:signal transduction histidine kinase
MSSGIAAPIGGRFLRTRTAGIGSAREHERKSLRRHLRVTTLRALDDVTAAATAEAAVLIAAAGDAATELRELVRELSAARDGGSGVAELRREVGATLHDTTLQALEYLAGDGYGAELSADTVRRVAADAAAELRGTLLHLGAPMPCELISGLNEVVSAAQDRGAIEVHLVTEDLDGRVLGADAAALVGAVREALNNVHKHAQASRALVRCEPSLGGARVTVHDDGVGADLTIVEEGLGLRHSIAERMSARGGHAHVDSEPGQGMKVTLTTARAGEVAA